MLLKKHDNRELSEISKILSDVQIPVFQKIKYNFPNEKIDDIPAAIRKALEREGTLDRITPGSTVAITGSSREINEAALIMKTVVDALKEKGAKPFIVPGMGSHGGATAEGQKSILEHYGITEEAMGVPVISNMETVDVGTTEDGLTVRIDKEAYNADFIIPMGRIKQHPEFSGKYESGIMKMMAIGLGKQHGAEVCHKYGMAAMPENIRKFGEVILQNCNIVFGIGIIETAGHGTHMIVAIPAEKIAEEEPALLQHAKSLVPVIPFEKADVLVCEIMGKDISGTGMDSTIIGRSISMGVSRPYFERITVFDLTDKSAGNFNGTGLCDCITRRIFDKMEFEVTYPNSITASETHSAMIPLVLDTDELCVRLCLRTCTQATGEGMRVVWIKDTLSVGEMYVSEALIEEAKNNPVLTVLDGKYTPVFNEKGEYVEFKGVD